MKKRPKNKALPKKTAKKKRPYEFRNVFNFSGGPRGFVVTVKVWLQQNHEEIPLAMPAIRLPQVSAVAKGFGF